MKTVWRVVCTLAFAALPASQAGAYLIAVHETNGDLTSLAQGEALIASTAPVAVQNRSIIEMDDLATAHRDASRSTAVP